MATVYEETHTWSLLQLQDGIAEVVGTLNKQRDAFSNRSFPSDFESLYKAHEELARYGDIRSEWRLQSVAIEERASTLVETGEMTEGAKVEYMRQLADAWCALDDEEDEYGPALEAAWLACRSSTVPIVEERCKELLAWCVRTRGEIAEKRGAPPISRSALDVCGADIAAANCAPETGDLTPLDVEIENQRSAVDYNCWVAEICAKDGGGGSLPRLVNRIETAWQDMESELALFFAEMLASSPTADGNVVDCPHVLCSPQDESAAVKRSLSTRSTASSDGPASLSNGQQVVDVEDDIIEQANDVINWCEKTHRRLEAELRSLPKSRSALEDLLSEFDRHLRHRDLPEQLRLKDDALETIDALARPSEDILAARETLLTNWSVLETRIMSYRQSLTEALRGIQEEELTTQETNQLLNWILHHRLTVEEKYREAKQGNSLFSVRHLHQLCRQEAHKDEFATAVSRQDELVQRLLSYKTPLSMAYVDNLHSAFDAFRQVMADAEQRLQRAVLFREQQLRQLMQTFMEFTSLIVNCREAAILSLSNSQPTAQQSQDIAMKRCLDLLLQSEMFKSDLEQRTRVFVSTEDVELTESWSSDDDAAMVAELQAAGRKEIDGLRSHHEQLQLEWKRLMDFTMDSSPSHAAHLVLHDADSQHTSYAPACRSAGANANGLYRQLSPLVEVDQEDRVTLMSPSVPLIGENTTRNTLQLTPAAIQEATSLSSSAAAVPDGLASASQQLHLGALPTSSDTQGDSCISPGDINGQGNLSTVSPDPILERHDAFTHQLADLLLWVRMQVSGLSELSELRHNASFQELEKRRSAIDTFESDILPLRAAEKTELLAEHATFDMIAPGVIANRAAATAMCEVVQEEWIAMEEKVQSYKTSVQSARQESVLPTPPRSPVSGYHKYDIVPKPTTRPVVRRWGSQTKSNTASNDEVDYQVSPRRVHRAPWNRSITSLLDEVLFSHDTIFLPF